MRFMPHKPAYWLACVRSQVVDKHTMLKKQILHPTSGHVVPGEMMALVGPSGAGMRHTLLFSCQCYARKSFSEHAGSKAWEGEETGASCREVHLARHPLAAERREGFWPGDTLGAASISTWNEADESPGRVEGPLVQVLAHLDIALLSPQLCHLGCHSLESGLS